jgi:hypothetical protein
MTIAFMAMVAAIISERISLRAGLWLLPLLLLVGMGSILQWYPSEVRGAGDLRFYTAVQTVAVTRMSDNLCLDCAHKAILFFKV